VDILGNREIANIKTDLLKKTKIDFLYYQNKIKEHQNNAVNWKFATDEMFTPIPFYHEMNNFEKGRLLKLETDKLNIVDEALKRNDYYAFGFSDDGSLIITMCRSHCTLYNHTNNEIEYFHIELNNKPSNNKLLSVGVLTAIQDNLQFNVLVASNVENWSAGIYEYEKNMLNKVYMHSKGWIGQVEYRFEYENDSLKKITALTTIDVWKKEE
jgi:hypothetical protein